MAILDRDGVALAYEERGSGDPPVLLIHGILCNRSYLAPQLDHFSARHRTVAVDLRGHGESGSPDQEYTIDGFADDVAWMAARLGLDRPVLIGHSLGGIVALAVASDRPASTRALVALDSVMAPPGDRTELMRAFFARLRSGDHVAVVREYFSTLFGPDDDVARCSAILDEIGDVSPQVALSAWENGFFHFDTSAAAERCRAPFLYLDAGTPNVDLDRLGRLCPTLQWGRTVGSGHFHQLEVPEQVNAMVDRFLATSVGP